MIGMPNIDRRNAMLAAGALGVLSFAGAATTQAQPGVGSRPPQRGNFVIRNGYVMTMDPSLRDIPVGDVHVNAGEIAAVGTNLEVRGAEIIDGRDMIVLPGFVDTHTHLWTTQMRGRFGATPETTYFRIRNVLANGYTAGDMYQGTRLGAAEAIHSGITTLLDFCHNIRGKDFAEACIRGLTETGIRARYLYGAATTTKPSEAIDLAYLEQLNSSWASLVGDAPVSLGLGWRGPLGFTTASASDAASPVLSVAKSEFELARRIRIPISVHVSGMSAKAQIEALVRGNFLGEDVQLIHFSNATPDQLKVAVEAGSSISLTPMTELRVGYGVTQLGDYLASGARVGLGVDSNSLAGAADMFMIMKMFQQIEAGRQKNEIAMAARRLLELATIEGARSIGMDDKIGSLRPGKRADLIMVTTRALNMGMFADDPAHLLVEAAQPANVDTVIVDGRILKRGGQLTVLDVDRLLGEAKESIANIVKRTRS